MQQQHCTLTSLENLACIQMPSEVSNSGWEPLAEVWGSAQSICHKLQRYERVKGRGDKFSCFSVEAKQAVSKDLYCGLCSPQFYSTQFEYA